MRRSSRAGLIKRGILLFWSTWISIVVLLNLGDLLRVSGLLSPAWKLASGNYDAIVKVTSAYGTPHWLDTVLFAAVILWEGLGMALFWRAFRDFRPRGVHHWRAVYMAFTVLLALFAVFILADEIFRSYRIEGDHRGITILLLASLLALQLLPDAVPA